VELRGERVVLRTLEAGDIPRLVEIGREPGFARWWPDLDEAGLRDDLAGTSGSVTFAVTVASEVVGIVQYYEEETPDYRHAGIDIGLETAAQDKGLGTDAVRTIARYLIDERGHHRLVIDPAADNHRAIRCYETVGFRPVGRMRLYERGTDGTWHDGLLMDLLAAELT
jgi:aminoglycoside 6'-N-acetyltransferase